MYTHVYIYIYIYIQSAHDDSAIFHTFDVCADMYVRVHVRCMCGVCAGCMCGVYVRVRRSLIRTYIAFGTQKAHIHMHTYIKPLAKCTAHT